MTDHPAGENIGVGKAKFWYGPEVEGRLRCSAPMTVFIDAALSSEDLEEVLLKIATSRVEHVFLTENFHDWPWFEARLLPTLQRRTHVPVTVARSGEEGLPSWSVDGALSLPYAKRFTVMARANMNAPWVHKLRRGDQVTVGVPYHLVNFEIEDARVTAPEDYKSDKR